MENRTINLMEVCGTHTMAIARFGLRKLFPPHVKLLSGPGCPVCVTPIEDIDRAISVGKRDDVIITTFGDMLCVPGSRSSLMKERAKGMDVRVVYSPEDALDIAAAHTGKKVVFLGVGFETTAPAVAAVILHARKNNIKNFFVLSMFKTVPAALETLLGMKGRAIDGFILPGHVSTVIGSRPYEFIAKKYGIGGVIAGFEPDDILRSVDMMLKQIKEKKPEIEIQYTRLVTQSGNKTAQRVIDKVFKPSDAKWRAIGTIPESGLSLRPGFKSFDALSVFDIKVPAAKEPRGCSCGHILLGAKTPKECGLFAKGCTPAHPIGPCMVSSEGACAAEYKYGGR